MSRTQIFVSYDTDHDAELYEQFLADSKRPNSGFEVSSHSERITDAAAWREKVCRNIRKADQVVVICGEHGAASTSMSAELRITLEEGTPYFLLWGRRDAMCTKPAGAKSAEGMYSWTRQILMDQITFTSRRVHSRAMAEARAIARQKT